MTWLWLLGCSFSVGTPPEPECAGVPLGDAFDQCAFERSIMAGPQDAERVLGLAKQVQEPVMLGLVVQGFVRAHARDLDRDLGRQLCGLLEGEQRGSCHRKLQAVHLQR